MPLLIFPGMTATGSAVTVLTFYCGSLRVCHLCRLPFIIGVADAQLRPYSIKEAHGVQGVFQRHHGALRETLLNAARHLAQLVRVSTAHDVKGFDPAFVPPCSNDQFPWVVDGSDALQVTLAAGDGGRARAVCEQRRGELHLRSVVVAEGHRI